MRRPPSRSALAILAVLFAASVAWTVLVFTWPPLAAVDQRWVAPPLDHSSPIAQIATALALLTWPGLQYAALLGLAWWAMRRRLRALAAALVLTVGLTWGLSQLLKIGLARPRPEHRLPILTTGGYSYPSAPVMAAVAVAITVGAIFAVRRRNPRAGLLWQLGAALAVVVVALDRWVLAAHYPSDLVGGALFGALVAVFSLVVSRVTVPVTHEIVQEIVRERARTPPPERTAPRCAVIYNPARVTDWPDLRRHVEYELRIRGWQRPLWMETTPEDPGRAMTAQAVAEQVDLVLGAGGDGTIRVICSGLADSGIPLAVIPAGTGNLLARNIGIPLDLEAAVDVAFDGVDKAIDLVLLRADDHPPEHFAVMAGVGVDAVIMQGTNPELKKAVGSAAYFVSAAQHANYPAVHATIRVDDEPVLRRRAHLILVGNVGLVSGNIQLFPDARPDDGRLDVLVASPRSARDWIRLVASVLTRRRRPDEQLDRLTGRRVWIEVAEPDRYQLDGDTAGSCRVITAEVQPAALVLRVPPLQRRTPLTGARDVASSNGQGPQRVREEPRQATVQGG